MPLSRRNAIRLGASLQGGSATPGPDAVDAQRRQDTSISPDAIDGAGTRDVDRRAANGGVDRAEEGRTMGTPTLASLQGPGASQDTSLALSPDAEDVQRRQDTSVVLSPDAVDAQRRQDPTPSLESQRATGAYQAERDRHPEPIEYSAFSSGVFNPRGTIGDFSMVSPGVYTRQDRSATPTVPVPGEDPKPTETPEYPYHWGQGISSPPWVQSQSSPHAPSGPLPAAAPVDEYRRRDPETGLSLHDIFTLSEMRETGDVQAQRAPDRLLEEGPGVGTHVLRGDLNQFYPGLLDSTERLRMAARKQGYTDEQINAFVALENTGARDNVLGMVVPGYASYQAARRGDWKGATIYAGLDSLLFVPGIGFVSRGLGAGARGVRVGAQGVRSGAQATVRGLTRAIDEGVDVSTANLHRQTIGRARSAPPTDPFVSVGSSTINQADIARVFVDDAGLIRVQTRDGQIYQYGARLKPGEPGYVPPQGGAQHFTPLRENPPPYLSLVPESRVVKALPDSGPHPLSSASSYPQSSVGPFSLDTAAPGHIFRYQVPSRSTPTPLPPPGPGIPGTIYPQPGFRYGSGLGETFQPTPSVTPKYPTLGWSSESIKTADAPLVIPNVIRGYPSLSPLTRPTNLLTTPEGRQLFTPSGLWTPPLATTPVRPTRPMPPQPTLDPMVVADPVTPIRPMPPQPTLDPMVVADPVTPIRPMPPSPSWTPWWSLIR